MKQKAKASHPAVLHPSHSLCNSGLRYITLDSFSFVACLLVVNWAEHWALAKVEKRGWKISFHVRQKLLYEDARDDDKKREKCYAMPKEIKAKASLVDSFEREGRCLRKKVAKTRRPICTAFWQDAHCKQDLSSEYKARLKEKFALWDKIQWTSDIRWCNCLIRCDTLAYLSKVYTTCYLHWADKLV